MVTASYSKNYYDVRAGVEDTNALAQDLHLAGWPPDALLHFEPLDSVSELESMVDGAGVLAGFGYEITLLRRDLAHGGLGRIALGGCDIGCGGGNRQGDQRQHGEGNEDSDRRQADGTCEHDG